MKTNKIKIFAFTLIVIFFAFTVLMVPATKVFANVPQGDPCGSTSDCATNLVCDPSSKTCEPQSSLPANTNLCAGQTCTYGCDSSTGLCNLNPNSNSTGNSSGSGVICDPSGYTMQNGLCIPNSPFSGGLASQNTLSGLITTILNIVLMLAGIIAVVFIIIGGYQYMTAGGNEERAEKGRKALVNAIIGLLIVILAFTIVTVVTNALTSASPLGK